MQEPLDRFWIGVVPGSEDPISRTVLVLDGIIVAWSGIIDPPFVLDPGRSVGGNDFIQCPSVPKAHGGIVRHGRGDGDRFGRVEQMDRTRVYWPLVAGRLSVERHPRVGAFRPMVLGR